jgi:acetylornithine deacetylase
LFVRKPDSSASRTRNFTTEVRLLAELEHELAGVFAAEQHADCTRRVVQAFQDMQPLVQPALTVARGKLAHSAYPELGHSAIHTLLDVLQDIRKIGLPQDSLLGYSTLNIGTISGGRAPNVVADQAQAEVSDR